MKSCIILICLVIILVLPISVSAQMCADADNNGAVNVLDIQYIWQYLFENGPLPIDSAAAAGIDGFKGINLNDIDVMISWFYSCGPAPDCLTGDLDSVMLFSPKDTIKIVQETMQPGDTAHQITIEYLGKGEYISAFCVCLKLTSNLDTFMIDSISFESSDFLSPMGQAGNIDSTTNSLTCGLLSLAGFCGGYNTYTAATIHLSGFEVPGPNYKFYIDTTYYSPENFTMLSYSCDRNPPRLPVIQGLGLEPVINYICGDLNSDGLVNILDVTYYIAYLYNNGAPPLNLLSADVNSDGQRNIIDITNIIYFLYYGGFGLICPY